MKLFNELIIVTYNEEKCNTNINKIQQSKLTSKTSYTFNTKYTHE
jgi:hypothetical protein